MMRCQSQQCLHQAAVVQAKIVLVMLMSMSWLQYHQVMNNQAAVQLQTALMKVVPKNRMMIGL
ncbi:MAG TPA: hypothetical protein DEG23_04145 [Coxiellaceae bacterium]|nr:MAG: hypothetical protein A2V89_03440 [Gammaproteobacteria bacterium RBG_16_37_9]HBC71195.1 hypothetical protein [Coxiellaceae bacterium]HBY55987.1 hypothetical protein [Coxiellaceae bacterium]